MSSHCREEVINHSHIKSNIGMLGARLYLREGCPPPPSERKSFRLVGVSRLGIRGGVIGWQLSRSVTLPRCRPQLQPISDGPRLFHCPWGNAQGWLHCFELSFRLLHLVHPARLHQTHRGREDASGFISLRAAARLLGFDRCSQSGRRDPVISHAENGTWNRIQPVSWIIRGRSEMARNGSK
ncbi:hypothetical protein VTK26DRAFT_7593 [Humicola hyalothermophila]